MREPKNSPRFFAPDMQGGVVELDDAEAHHGLHVLRLRAGDAVEVFDGAGRAARGAFRPVGKRGAQVIIAASLPAQPRPQPEVELAFAVPKGKRLDWLVEKATELGASRLAPVVFERSVVEPDLNEHARARWRGVCVSAAKQCRTDFLPEIVSPRPVAQVLADVQARGDLGLMGDAASVTTIPAAMASWRSGQWVTLLVGPEGDLTEAEKAAAVAAGFQPVRLGRLILRVETAAVALLAAVRALRG